MFDLMFDLILPEQPEVIMIYLMMLFSLITRLYLTFNMKWVIPKTARMEYLRLHEVLIAYIENSPVMLGVLGTLIGINYALLSSTAENMHQQLLSAFSISLHTTLLGGWIHLLCFIIATFDPRLCQEQ